MNNRDRVIFIVNRPFVAYLGFDWLFRNKEEIASILIIFIYPENLSECHSLNKIILDNKINYSNKILIVKGGVLFKLLKVYLAVKQSKCSILISSGGPFTRAAIKADPFIRHIHLDEGTSTINKLENGFNSFEKISRRKRFLYRIFGLDSILISPEKVYTIFGDKVQIVNSWIIEDANLKFWAEKFRKLKSSKSIVIVGTPLVGENEMEELVSFVRKRYPFHEMKYRHHKLEEGRNEISGVKIWNTTFVLEIQYLTEGILPEFILSYNSSHGFFMEKLGLYSEIELINGWRFYGANKNIN